MSTISGLTSTLNQLVPTSLFSSASASGAASPSFALGGQEQTTGAAGSADPSSWFDAAAGGQIGQGLAQSIAQSRSALLSVQEQAQGGQDAGRTHHGRHHHRHGPQPAVPSGSQDGNLTNPLTGPTAVSAAGSNAATASGGDTGLSAYLAQQGAAAIG